MGISVADLSLRGNETLTFAGLDNIKVGENPVMLHRRGDEYVVHPLSLVLRIDAFQEIRYLYHGGILPYITRKVVG